MPLVHLGILFLDELPEFDRGDASTVKDEQVSKDGTLLQAAIEQMNLFARAYDQILKVPRAITDIMIGVNHDRQGGRALRSFLRR